MPPHEPFNVANFLDEDIVAANGNGESSHKAKTKRAVPPLPDDPDVEQLRDWLTIAFRPPAGWRVESFERAGIRRDQACNLTFVNGRERRKYRFGAQGDLVTRMRTTVVGVSSGLLRMAHLSPVEVEDVWAGLCILGNVLEEEDEPEQARDWLRKVLDATRPLVGYSLERGERYAALMHLRSMGEFTWHHAISIKRGHPEESWPRYPVRLIDCRSDEHWIRAGEAATFLRHMVGVDPLPATRLNARWAEIGVPLRRVEDRRPPHPKLQLFRVPAEFVEHLASDGGISGAF